MTALEWHKQALSCARRALFEYQVANQAMYDARKALACRGEAEKRVGALGHDDTHLKWADKIARIGCDIPPTLQDLVNALERDPILDEPKDIHSAGDEE